jgi:hypothetical protein
VIALICRPYASLDAPDRWNPTAIYTELFDARNTITGVAGKATIKNFISSGLVLNPECVQRVVLQQIPSPKHHISVTKKVECDK